LRFLDSLLAHAVPEHVAAQATFFATHMPLLLFPPRSWSLHFTAMCLSAPWLPRQGFYLILRCGLGSVQHVGSRGGAGRSHQVSTPGGLAKLCQASLGYYASSPLWNLHPPKAELLPSKGMISLLWKAELPSTMRGGSRKTHALVQNCTHAH
jgi:hypothetical protein